MCNHIRQLKNLRGVSRQKKKNCNFYGESKTDKMAQKLRVHNDLAKEMCSVPSTMSAGLLLLKFQLQGIWALLASIGTTLMCTCPDTDMHVHAIKYKKYKLVLERWLSG